MTTIDHAGSLAVSGSGALTDDRIARRALQVARRTALGVLGDTEAAADVAQDVAITAVRRAGSLRDPAALDAWLHRIAVRAALREARRRAGGARPSARVTTRHRATITSSPALSRCSTACRRASAPR
jgi:DNA-directed RNA polymerase specialized sigma24 family protein